MASREAHCAPRSVRKVERRVARARHERGCPPTRAMQMPTVLGYPNLRQSQARLARTRRWGSEELGRWGPDNELEAGDRFAMADQQLIARERASAAERATQRPAVWQIPYLDSVQPERRRDRETTI